MSLSATLFGRDSLIFKATNILGLGIPGWLDKTFGAGDTPGPALGELAQQTAKEGESRAIVWGRVRPIGGNITHCQAPIKRWVKEKTSGGGKGGSKKKTQNVEHVFRTYAIGVCEGPITKFSRIWRNNKLVYDARGNDWGNTNNPVFLRQYRLYTGSWSQMPDPTLQSIWGAGNVPAYRGTAYIVAIDEDLTDLGGSVPQWLFEVERAEGIFYTSRPYAIEAVEGIQAGQATARVPPHVPPDELQAGQAEIIAGVLRAPLVAYVIPAEAVDAEQAEIVDGSLRQPLVAYTNWPPEGLDAASAEIISGTLKVGLVSYTNWPVEAVDAGQAEIIGGTLT